MDDFINYDFSFCTHFNYQTLKCKNKNSLIVLMVQHDYDKHFRPIGSKLKRNTIVQSNIHNTHISINKTKKKRLHIKSICKFARLL